MENVRQHRKVDIHLNSNHVNEMICFVEQRSRSQSQQKSRNQEDVCVRISLPPLVEGPVYAILICHIPKLRWNAKYQLLCRYVNVKVSWWGEDDTSAIFKYFFEYHFIIRVSYHLFFLRPQVSGVSSASNQTPSTTAKYYIRSELKQFARYLTGRYLFDRGIFLLYIRE